MGNIMSAIYDDMDEYKENCRRFREPVQRKNGYPDCYGHHAKELERRIRQPAPESKSKFVGNDQ